MCQRSAGYIGATGSSDLFLGPILLQVTRCHCGFQHGLGLSLRLVLPRRDGRCAD